MKILILGIALLLRAGTSLHGYSGKNKPPLYGDFEAQRHWQEITVNLPTSQWYVNSTYNDLLYWGLDYPPLTAYHSFLCGKLASYINPDYTELLISKGLESDEHKLFMRYTVLVADLFVFIPAVLYFGKIFDRNYLSIIKNSKKSGNNEDKKCNGIFKNFYLIMILFYPGLILIDNGHFQYNNISLGFAILAIAYLMNKNDYKACISFVLALNYKQMELYHAFPIFVYLFANSFKNGDILKGFCKVFCLGFVVISTFLILWLPFIGNIELLAQVLHRIFPLARGIFEDKVSNVWCALNVIVKLKTLFDTRYLVIVCAIVTLITIIPSNAILFMYPSKVNLKYSLFTTALSFFLFSFQVHEKSILLAAIPASLLFNFEPLFTFWFLHISSFSMLPLLMKDQLLLPYLVLNIFYVFTFIWYCLLYQSENMLNQIFNISWKLRPESNKSDISKSLLKLGFHLSILSTVALTLLITFVQPPHKYPDIFPLLISVVSCAHFFLFFLYFNVKLVCINLIENGLKCI